MAESTEVQALSKISNEIDEAQINVILTSQCIKAQAFLLDKLRKQSEHHKEVIGFISSANLKLECEIKQAEFEIHSLRNSLDTIKHANIDLRKEYLLAQDNKYEITERIEVGEKKYEQLWLESKARYESIPFVKRFLQAQNTAQTLQEGRAKYENFAKRLAKEIENKMDDFEKLDKKRIVELAAFVVHDVPTKCKIIQDIIEKTNGLCKEIEIIEKELKATYSTSPNIRKEINESKIDASQDKNDATNGDNWACLLSDDSLMMPKFDENNIDLDFLSDKLDKVKKADMLFTNMEEISASSGNKNENRHTSKYDWNLLNMEPYISPYFPKKNDKETMNETRYSDKKLINILNDVNLEKRDAYNILAKVNPYELQEVNMINSNLETFATLKQNAKVPTESERLTPCPDDIVVPPTQFLDSSQEQMCAKYQPTEGTEQMAVSETNTNIPHTKSSQENKKRVTFHSVTPVEIPEIPEKLDESIVNELSPIINNTLDTSAVSDEDFIKIKDMVLKKRNLESSPQFVYAKNVIPSNATNPATIMKSKFFEEKNYMECENATADGDNKEVDDSQEMKGLDENPDDPGATEQNKENAHQQVIQTMEIDNADDFNVKISTSEKSNVAGLLFTHGMSTLPESLNVSISTSGYEDGDFPHYIDSNLLLSPKDDIQMGDDNLEVKSQEVPNFLSGLRKTGLSIFGDMQSSTPNTDNGQNQDAGNSFKFSFGGEDKKSRGGFFNMFN